MINFWDIICCILDFFFRLISRNKPLFEDSDTHSSSDNNHRTQDHAKSQEDFRKSAEEDPPCITTKVRFCDSNSCLKKRPLPQENTEDKSDLDYEVYKEILVQTEGSKMKRNYARRNSKRFVIGDGDDEFEAMSQMPDITITETAEEQSRVWTKESSSNRLSVRSTLT